MTRNLPKNLHDLQHLLVYTHVYLQVFWKDLSIPSNTSVQAKTGKIKKRNTVTEIVFASALLVRVKQNIVGEACNNKNKNVEIFQRKSIKEVLHCWWK